jgi:hypothetical protein
MTPEIQALFDLLRDVGFAGLFALLFMNEKRDRTADRIRYETEISDVRSAWMSDIREIAGMRRSLYSVDPNSSVPRTIEPIKTALPSEPK